MKNINDINKILISIQILLSFLYFEYPYINILFIYVLMLEFVMVNLKNDYQYYGKNLKYYISYLFLKFFFVFYVYLTYSNYDDIFLIVMFQTLLFFLNKDMALIYKKRINSIFSAVILTTLTIYIIYYNCSFWNIFLIYPIITVILLHIKIIKQNPNFCNEYASNSLLPKIQKIPLSFLTAIYIIFIELFNIIHLTIASISVIVIVFLITILYEKKQYQDAKKYGIKIYHYYMLTLILIFSILFFYFLMSVDINDGIYKDYALSIFNAITNIAILNIASLFIILQLNYNKFGSSYLLFKIIKSPILLFITFLPSLLLILNMYFLKQVTGIFEAIPTLFLLMSYLSTFMLFIYTYYFIETNFLMYKLFKDVMYNDIRTYKKNIIHNKETNIDAILILITKVINNNDSTISQSLFFHLFCWVNSNISNINKYGNSFEIKRDNKFYDFFTLIINNLSVANNNVLHNNFINAIREIIIRKVNVNNYDNYKIIYIFLFDYLQLSLKNNNLDTAESIYRLIYFKCPIILMEMKEIKLGKYEMLDHESTHDHTIMFTFEDIFLNPLKDVVEVSIKNNQLEFLSNRRFYDDIFVGVLSIQDKIDYSKWDGKIFEIFNKLRYIRSEADKYVMKNAKYWSWYIKDYDTLFPYYYRDKKRNYKYATVLQKYVFTILRDNYEYAIDNKIISSDFEFEIFWSQIHSTIYAKDNVQFKEFVSIFTFIFEKLCKKYIMEESNLYIVKSVYLRVIQIQSFQELNDECKFFIDLKVKQLESVYPKLIELKNTDNKRQLIRDIDILEDYNISKNEQIEYNI